MVDSEPRRGELVRQEAYNERCLTITGSRYEYRTIHLEESDLDVHGVLVGVCETCGSIPAVDPAR
jgi:hypothetical protein